MKIDQQNITFEDGTKVCEYLPDRQIIYYLDGTYEENHIVDGVFSRESDYYGADGCLTGQTRLPIRNGNVSEGLYMTFDDKGELVKRHKVIVDFEKRIETTFRDDKGNGVLEIAELDPVNFSSTKVSRYYPSKNLEFSKEMKDNLQNGTVLYFYNSRSIGPKNQLCNTKKNLEMASHYEGGFLLSRTAFNKNGSPDKMMISNKRSPQDDLFEEHFYHDKQLIIRYSNMSYTYQEKILQNGLLAKNKIYDEDRRLICLEACDYHYDPSSGYSESHKAQYFPSSWDDEGDVTAGHLKQFDHDTLIGSGPFVNINDYFIEEGVHIYRNGDICHYKSGHVIENYMSQVAELNGELVILNPQKPASKQPV